MQIFNMQGIGVDIENIERFREKPFEKHHTFYGKIFTKTEQKYCLAHKDPAPHFAVRFCAKEAAVKALGKAIDFRGIEIRNDKNGKPHLSIKGKETARVLVSLSHTDKYALAFVIICP